MVVLKSEEMMEVNDVRRRAPIFKLGSGEVELLDSGLEAVQSLFNAPESKFEKQVLEKIGLANALTSIWQGQDPQVCKEFIRNWDRRAKRTTVFGVPIEVDLNSFLSVTGLSGNNLPGPTIKEATNCGKAWKYGMFCGAEQGPWCSHEKDSPPLLVCGLRNELMRHLLVLLNKTLLLGPKNPLTLSRASVYLLVEALQGNMMGWGTCVHERFMCIMGHFRLYQGIKTSLMQTLAGPLMCFLYAHARDKARSDVSHINRVEFKHSARRGRWEMAPCAAQDVREGKHPAQPCKAIQPRPANNVSKKRPLDDVIRLGHLPSELATGVPSSSTDQAQGSKVLVSPSTPENPSKWLCRGNTSDMYKEPSSDISQHLVKLRAKVRDLTEKLDDKEEEISGLVVSQQEFQEEVDRKNKEILRLQQAEKDFSTCYGSLETLYAQALKNVQDLQKVIFQLTVREAEPKENATRLERVQAEEQKHAKEFFKLHFPSAATEGEVVELKHKVEELSS